MNMLFVVLLKCCIHAKVHPVIMLMTKIGNNRMRSVWPVKVFVVGLAWLTDLIDGSDRSDRFIRNPSTTMDFVDLDL